METKPVESTSKANGVNLNEASLCTATKAEIPAEIKLDKATLGNLKEVVLPVGITAIPKKVFEE